MANNMSTQDKRIVVKGTSPAGTAIFPKLFEPDYKWKEEGEYSVKLKLDADAAQPLIEQIEGLVSNAFKEAEDNCKNARDKAKLKMATPCYEEELDEDGNVTGFYLFRFKQQASGISKKTGKKWTRTPAVFDGKGKPITNPEYQVWSGSIVRVAYELTPFSTNIGVGCSCRLIACQIIELATGQSKDASTYGFDAEEGGFDNGMGEGYGASVRDSDEGIDGGEEKAAASTGDDGDY